MEERAEGAEVPLSLLGEGGGEAQPAGEGGVGGCIARSPVERRCCSLQDLQVGAEKQCGYFPVQDSYYVCTGLVLRMASDLFYNLLSGYFLFAGLGKTTLAHVVARHCGYHPFEMNASDDRTAGNLTQRINDAVQMKAVLGGGR